MNTAPNPTTTPIDEATYRSVLGHLPTGVVAVCGLGESGQPFGMAVGSFSSVSIDPPLVAFYPDRRSSTFPKLLQAARFSVHILAAHQEAVCRAMAVSGGDKFVDVDWGISSWGTPRIAGAAAWLECEIGEVIDAGDHFLVLARVLALGTGDRVVPLIFFQGGYGAFSPMSLTIPATAELLEPLRLVDSVRKDLEQLAVDLNARCYAHALLGSEAVVVSGAEGRSDRALPGRVGMSFPLMLPWGASFAAWIPLQARTTWLDSQNLASHEEQSTWSRRLDAARTAGWCFTTRHSDLDEVEVEVTVEIVSRHRETPTAVAERRRLSEHVGTWGDPNQLDRIPQGGVKSLAVPALNGDGELLLLLSVHDLPASVTHEALISARRRLMSMAAVVSAAHDQRR